MHNFGWSIRTYGTHWRECTVLVGVLEGVRELWRTRHKDR